MLKQTYTPHFGLSFIFSSRIFFRRTFHTGEPSHSSPSIVSAGTYDAPSSIGIALLGRPIFLSDPDPDRDKIFSSASSCLSPLIPLLLSALVLVLVPWAPSSPSTSSRKGESREYGSSRPGGLSVFQMRRRILSVRGSDSSPRFGVEEKKLRVTCSWYRL